MTLVKEHRANTLIAYWLLGLCNNYGYVVMLTAAHDILSSFDNKSGNGSNTSSTVSNDRDCNIMSTGVILLADIIPGLAVKMVCPFIRCSINVRVAVVVISSILGFVVVGKATTTVMALVGVAFTSFASGLGETALLSYTVFFKNQNILSMWSSGTGAAGIFGSFTYTAFVALGVSSSSTLYILTIIPLTMAFSFWCLLGDPFIKNDNKIQCNSIPDNATSNNDVSKLSILNRLKYIPTILPYFGPLFFVYVFEYFINQGLFELLHFKNTFLNDNAQYRWYQVLYQIGVFISRSSISCVQINYIWLFAVLQGLNMVYLTIDSIYGLTPHIVLLFLFILWEGLLGGGAYVNTFNKIQHEVNMENQEFATALTTVSDSLGVCIAGFLAIPAHNFICTLPP